MPLKRARCDFSLKLLLIFLSYFTIHLGQSTSENHYNYGRQGTDFYDSEEEEDEWWVSTNSSNNTEVCRGMMVINSTEVIYPDNVGSGDYSSCSTSSNDYRCSDHNYTSLETYPYSVSYINAQSTIIATVDLNDTESYSELYYELCYRNILDSDGSELIGCVSNGTVMVSEYKWKEYGPVILTVNVYTNSTYNESYFLDCAVTQVTVARDYGLNLTVEERNEPYFSNISTQPFPENEKERWKNLTDIYLVGNMTLLPNATLTNATLTNATLSYDYSGNVTYYYKYIITGPSLDEVLFTTMPSWTQECPEKGCYQYTVHAIAKKSLVVAYHANYSGEFCLFAGVSDVGMLVGNNNYVKVGSQEQITISANGSTPITVCWFRTKLQTALALPTENCIVINSSSSDSASASTVVNENTTFNEVGTFQYVAHFCNTVNCVWKNFTVNVLSVPTPPVVVASSATAVVVFAVVVTVIVVVIIFIVGGYIPYRRYKNRMTETADFSFVDLTEKTTFWDRVKLKTSQLKDYFKRKRENEKIGLVNLGSLPLTDERRLFYGTNTLTHFAPYETI